MKIELEEPFKSDWRRGYLVTNSESRKNVILFNSSKERTTVSYARYLMSVHLGRYLKSSEHVDHKDEDKTNDNIDNLQILSPADNTLKNIISRNKQAKCVILNCSSCGSDFVRSVRKYQMGIAQGNSNFFCSRSCQTTYPLRKIPRAIGPKVDVPLIKELRKQGLSSYAISKQTGISRNSVMKYWK